MVEKTTTYDPISLSALTSKTTITASSTSSSFVVKTGLGSSFNSKPRATVAPISVRTSDKTIRSFSTGGMYEYVQPKGVGSFVRMHKEISDAIFLPSAPYTPQNRAFAGKPDDPPIGETNPDLPVGDALLPLLLCACVYAVLHIFCNRKKNQLANKSVNKQSL